jgi:glutamine synthetase type III
MKGFFIMANMQIIVNNETAGFNFVDVDISKMAYVMVNSIKKMAVKMKIKIENDITDLVEDFGNIVFNGEGYIRLNENNNALIKINMRKC